MSQYEHPQYSTVYTDVGMSPWMSKQGPTPTPTPDTSYTTYTMERSVSRTSLPVSAADPPRPGPPPPTDLRDLLTTTGLAGEAVWDKRLPPPSVIKKC